MSTWLGVKDEKCHECPENTYTEREYINRGRMVCKQCPEATPKSERGSTSLLDCYNPRDMILEKILHTLDKQKEQVNDLSIKNSRLWQKEQIRLQRIK